MEYRFDDQNGVLSIGEPDQQEAYFFLHVFAPLSTNNDLVADSLKIINSHFIGNQYFVLRSWDKTTGTVFMYSARDEVASGQCAISKGYYSLVRPKVSPDEILYPPLQNQPATSTK